MSWCLGLNIEHSFCDVVAWNDSKAHSRRWFLPQTSLEAGLRDFATAQQIQGPCRIVVGTKLVSQILEKQYGTPPSLLVTSGFEHWLDMTWPAKKGNTLLQPKSIRSPLHSDLVFGISERTLANGEIEKPVEIADLEFLAQKLNLNEVSHVAIGFLNANANPENEVKATTFFREKGFKVSSGWELTNQCAKPTGPANEIIRWKTAILESYCRPLFDEKIQDIRTILLTLFPESEIQFSSSCPVSTDRFCLPTSSGSVSLFPQALQSSFEKSRLPGWVCYFGWEDFLLIGMDGEQRPTSHCQFGDYLSPQPKTHRFRVQPTSTVIRNSDGLPQLTSTEIGYEPGPACWGRGLALTFLDVLFLHGHLTKALDGPERWSDPEQSQRLSKRITESFISLSKSSQNRNQLSVELVTQWIEQLALKEILLELKLQAVKGPVWAVGPLAQPFHQLLSTIKAPAEWSWILPAVNAPVQWNTPLAWGLAQNALSEKRDL